MASWIKEANKLGEYRNTYQGFRIYCVEEPRTESRVEKRESETFRITDFISGKYVAVNKNGVKIFGKGVDDLGVQIDFFSINERCIKREQNFERREAAKETLQSRQTTGKECQTCMRRIDSHTVCLFCSSPASTSLRPHLKNNK